jgi:hypothetical protein
MKYNNFIIITNMIETNQIYCSTHFKLTDILVTME